MKASELKSVTKTAMQQTKEALAAEAQTGLKPKGKDVRRGGPGDCAVVGGGVAALLGRCFFMFFFPLVNPAF